jgi:hypothetical protein
LGSKFGPQMNRIAAAAVVLETVPV